jgi:hypothetical protein
MNPGVAELEPPELIDVGPLVPITIGPARMPAASVVKGRALVDTGARVSCTRRGFLASIGLPSIGVAHVRGFYFGDVDTEAYAVRLGIAAGYLDGVELFEVPTFEDYGYDVILGRDCLQYLQLVYDGPGDVFSLTLERNG